MADTRITDLANLLGANVAANDQLVLVDVSDTSMAASGTDKHILASELAAAIVANIANGSLTSAMIADGSVANADLANMTQSTIKGRASGAGTGAPVDLTATQTRTIIDTNTTPSTQAFGDAATVGTADTLARGDHKHAWPSFATPAIVLGSSAAAGAATTPIRSDGTIAAFDATSPTTQVIGDTAVVGTAAFAARRDHKHAFPTAADIYALAASINTQTASYTLVLGDAGKIVEINNASANTLTIPPNSSVAFPIGTIITFTQYGAGATTITAGAGVTIRCRLTLVMKGQYSTAQAYKRATDEWVLSGDLT